MPAAQPLAHPVHLQSVEAALSVPDQQFKLQLAICVSLVTSCVHGPVLRRSEMSFRSRPAASSTASGTKGAAPASSGSAAKPATSCSTAAEPF